VVIGTEGTTEKEQRNCISWRDSIPQGHHKRGAYLEDGAHIMKKRYFEALRDEDYAWYR
jgi:hypothetical protein